MKSIKSTLILVSLFITFSIMSCDKEENKAQSDCVTHFLDEFDMVAYNGEELGCKTHIRLYDYEGTIFAVMDNHCADFGVFEVFDCDGNFYCTGYDTECRLTESIDHGIIGIKK